MKLPIYMDYHATTPLDPRVLEAMMPCLKTDFGNAASANHPFGWKADNYVKEARQQVARLIHADPKEIIFTSGATESNNLAIKGIAENYRKKGNHIITQVTEHKSVLDTAQYLEQNGFRVTYLPVDSSGQISLTDLEFAITDETILISIMFANNEIGTIQPIEAIGKLAKQRGIVFHVDGAQAVGKVPVDVERMGIDLLAFSGHKMYGPKGVGALYVRRKNPNIRLSPLAHGGGHEGGMRSGTLNVPAIVGLGKACELCVSEMDQDAKRIGQLRDRLQDALSKNLEDATVHGHPAERLYNNLNIGFSHVDGEALIMAINESIAVSSGSACTTGSSEPSFVLKAIGVDEKIIHSSIRFGLGRFSTQEEVDYVTEQVTEAVKKLRAISPFYEEKSS